MDLLGTLRGDFENLAYDLLTSDPAPRLTEATPTILLFTFPGGKRTVLFKFAPNAEQPLVARMKKAMQLGIEEVVLVGGPAEAARLLKDAAPFFWQRRSKRLHLPDVPRADTALIGHGLKSPLGKILQAGIRGAPSDEGFSSAVQRGVQSQTAVASELHEFSRSLQSQRPVATYAIAASIIAMFIVETALGGSEKSQVLIRLGAMVPSRLHDEPWRLFTAAFLHIGILHLAFNTYVLVVIGTLLERVIGTWRFLVVYWVAVLCGSLMSAGLSPYGLEAGASGGVIGLLAAQSALAFVPRGLLPQEVIPGMRRSAMINLVINVVNSLRPGISLTAHLGGALAGAALIFAPFFTAGLPKLGVAEPGEPKVDRLPIWMRPAALLGVALMVISLGFALVKGDVLNLHRAQKWSAVAIGDTGLQAQLPEGFQAHPLQVTKAVDNTRTEASFGDLETDGAQLTLRVIDFPAAFDESARPQQLQSLQAAFAKVEAGFHVESAAQIVSENGHDLVTDASIRENDQARYERAATVSANRIVIASALISSDAPELNGLAARVLKSISLYRDP
jgi:rhomboid protease GluP